MGFATAAIIGGSLAAGAATAGASKQAGDAKADAARKASQTIAEQIQQARGTAAMMTPGIEANILAGAGAGLETLGQGLGTAMGARQAGNIQAQDVTRQSMPAYQAALLGQPMPALPEIYKQQLPELNYALPEFVSTAGLMDGNIRAAQDAGQLIQQGDFTQSDIIDQQRLGQSLEELPQFAKHDISKPSIQSGNLDQRIAMAQEAIGALSPEQYELLRQQGPAALGLGGRRGTNIYNQIMSTRSA